MKNRLAALACQRRRLLDTIEAQRAEVREVSRRFEKPMAMFDVGMNAVHFVYRHPNLMASGFAAIMAVWRKGIPGLNYLLPISIRFALNSIFSSTRLKNKK
jgi:hypothetical protein